MERPSLNDALAKRDSVMRAFVGDDGRVHQIPVKLAKRLVVLDYVEQAFEVGLRYPEPEVIGVLRRFHDDWAALRRYLVDEGFLERASGLYWRSGGSVS
jgi:hypothetical protein